MIFFFIALFVFWIISLLGIWCESYLLFSLWISFVFILIGVWGKLERKRLIQYKNKFFFMKNIFKNLDKAHEIIVFDEEIEAPFTTHPHIYPSKEAFLEKIHLSLDEGEDRDQFLESVQNNEEGTFVLSRQKRQFLLSQIKPLKDHSCFITMTDCSEQMESLYMLKKQCLRMEELLDRSPFGFVYLSKNKTITALNQTFANWIGLAREKIIGEAFGRFIDLSKGDKALIRSSYGPSFPAVITRDQNILWFSKCPKNKLENFDQNDMFVQTAVPAILVDSQGQIFSMNPAFSEFIHDIKNLQVGMNICEVMSSNEELLKNLKKAIGKTYVSPFEIRFQDDQLHATVYLRCLAERFENPMFILQLVDISVQKRLESQFIQSQKMQAVGQLAGGIAHDFNNLLTAMIGFCDLLLQRYMPNDPSYMDIIQIKQNANRATNLVKQLLAFSRQQTLQPRVVCLTDTLAELSALLKRLIGANIDFKMIHESNLWTVKVDPSQMEQVIINLVVNARDAMQDGGKLVVKSSNIEIKYPRSVWHETMPPGDYVMIEVIDQGCGISDDHIDQIFEPFFSTKGAGTGLGLATVYGIIKQTGGFIDVESDVGYGSTFKIFLPYYIGTITKEDHSLSLKAVDLSGQATILLVEDEDAVRLFGARALTEKGYKVIEARSGEDALALIEEGLTFDLLITDVVMPHMDGPTLCKKIQETHPALKVLFISGYTEEAFRDSLDENVQFLSKPFTLKELAEKVKELTKNS